MRVCECIRHLPVEAGINPSDLYPLHHRGRSASPLDSEVGLFTNGEKEKKRGEVDDGEIMHFASGYFLEEVYTQCSITIFITLSQVLALPSCRRTEGVVLRSSET